MNSRIATGLISILACALLIGAGLKQRELTRLRAQNQRVAATLDSARQKAAAEANETALGPTVDDSAKIELLRLRNEVSQLMERKKGLASLRSENQMLQARLTAKGTNTASGLPPGYLRTRDAQWVGTTTPENTLQSFLWALKNRDQNSLLRLLTPEAGDQLKNNLEGFFNGAQIPGMRPVNPETLSDGSINMPIELAPGEGALPGKTIHFRQINGEWRMDLF